MEFNDYKIYIRYEDHSMRLNIYIFGIDHLGNRHFCTSVDKKEFEVHVPGTAIERPTISLDGWLCQPFLQSMANELNNLGIKPEAKPILENELTAVKYHLEDMRKISFDLLKVKNEVP